MQGYATFQSEHKCSQMAFQVTRDGRCSSMLSGWGSQTWCTYVENHDIAQSRWSVGYLAPVRPCVHLAMPLLFGFLMDSLTLVNVHFGQQNMAIQHDLHVVGWVSIHAHRVCVCVCVCVCVVCVCVCVCIRTDTHPGQRPGTSTSTFE